MKNKEQFRTLLNSVKTALKDAEKNFKLIQGMESEELRSTIEYSYEYEWIHFRCILDLILELEKGKDLK